MTQIQLCHKQDNQGLLSKWKQYNYHFTSQLTWHFTSMSKKTSSPSGCSAFASRWLYREGVWGASVPGDGTGRKANAHTQVHHQLQDFQPRVIVAVSTSHYLAGGLGLCCRWAVYKAGWRCWDASQENGSCWLVGRPDDGPGSWPAAPGNDQDPAMVFRIPK